MKDKNAKVLKKIKVVKQKKQPVDKKALKKIVDNHKKAAAHHMEAAKNLLEAAKHYQAGQSEKAAQFALLAHGHHAIAGQFLTDDAKHHAQQLKLTNFRF